MAARKIVERERGLRRTMSLPEVKLWAVLRTRPNNIRFRRQHPIGPFVLDFYSPAAKLAIEIDGIAHDLGDNPQRDIERDAQLRTFGIETTRFPASEILHHLEAVVTAILQRCAFPLHHAAHGPPPHPTDGEDDRRA